MKWFDTKTRAAQILILLERTLEYAPDKLSKKLGVSNKTISNEIKRLNEELGTSARIELKDGKYHLYLFEISEFVKIRDRITKPVQDFDNRSNRFAYILKTLISSDDFVKIDDLAFDMSISRTTFNKDLNQLKDLLDEYEIEIIGIPNRGLRIKGEEFNLRRFLVDRVYTILYPPETLDADIWASFNEILDSYLLEKETVKQMGRYFTVCLDRYLNGYPIEFRESYFYELVNESYFEIAERINKELQKILGVKLPVEEQLFLILPLMGMRTPVDLETLDSFITIDKDAIELVDKIIENIRIETDLTFDFDESLDEFIFHIIFLINRLKYRVYLDNPIKSEMKAKYGLAWKMAERTAKTIEENLDIKVSENEIGFLTSYFALILKEHELKSRNNFRVLVIHQKGGAAMRLIGLQLKHILSPEVEIVTRANRPSVYDDIEDFDLIITTDKLDLETDTAVIEIDEIVDEKVLEQQIKRFEYTHALNIPSKNSGNSALLSLLDENKVFIFPEDSTYIQIVTTLADAMIKQGLADEEFTKRILLRESQQSMRFTEKLAFPHIFHNKDDKPFAAIGLVPDGLKESGSQDLRIVILAGLPKETKDNMTLVELYEEIVKISENETTIEELSELQSYWDILNYFIVKNPIFD